MIESGGVNNLEQLCRVFNFGVELAGWQKLLVVEICKKWVVGIHVTNRAKW